MSGSKHTGIDALGEAARICERAFSSQGLEVVARVWDTARAFDIALGVTPGARIVVRCVTRAEASDYKALNRMLAAGDFDRAVLIYTDEVQSHLCSEIETWSLSGLDALGAALARWSAP
ncbi:MAG: hypothetical protein ABL871_11680 [Terricaulis sp.]